MPSWGWAEETLFIMKASGRALVRSFSVGRPVRGWTGPFSSGVGVGDGEGVGVGVGVGEGDGDGEGVGVSDGEGVGSSEITGSGVSSVSFAEQAAAENRIAAASRITISFFIRFSHF